MNSGLRVQGKLRTFLFGPKLALGVNAVLLAYLMYRSQLVPRAIAVLGLIGGTLVFASGTAVLSAAMPVLTWELSVAGWMIVKGVPPSPVDLGPVAPANLTRSVPVRGRSAIQRGSGEECRESCGYGASERSICSEQDRAWVRSCS